jgi:hypothetical protein
MVEVTVRVCDICKERIAIGNCPICGKDVDKPCTQAFSLELGMKWRGPAVEIFRENICNECAKDLEGRSKEIITRLASRVQPEVKEVLKSYSKSHG